MENLYLFDKKYRDKYKIIAGIDEAGRGPLAGPVVAAAVILDEKFNSELINDSKKLSPKKREKAFFLIKKNAIDLKVTAINNVVIDKINILNAALMAMSLSVEKLHIKPDIALIDGNRSPNLSCKEKLIIKGDQKSLSIAAASIVAKYIRDKIMLNYSKIYPEYEFEKHKGYPTVKHKKLIAKYGFCNIHRKSFNSKIK
jgi:ribonuclease HII